MMKWVMGCISAFGSNVEIPYCQYYNTCISQPVTTAADPGVVRLIPARSHTFVEIDQEITILVILLLPLIQEGLLRLQEKACTQSTG